MKKRPLFYLFCIVATIGGLFVSSCNDDDYPGATPDEITAHYSNKLSDGTRANLSLTYNGHDLIGKSVNLETGDSRTAKITLQCVLPHEAETVITDVALSPDGQGGYTFSGIGTGSQTATTFGYSGSVKKGHLSVDVSGAQIPANPLAQAGTLNMVATDDETIDEESPNGTVRKTLHASGTGTLYISSLGMNVGDMVGNLAGNFLKTVLGDIKFNADGNIIASYAGIPEGLDIMQDLINGKGIQNRPEADWNQSPVNLVSYYMADDNTIYVTPNVDMIIRQIRLNQATTRADDNLLVALPKAYALLNQWATTGIKLEVKKNSKEYVRLNSTTYVRYEGDYTITFNKDEIDPILSLIRVLPDIIKDINIEIPGLGEVPLGFITDIIGSVTDFSLTFYFNAENAG